MFKEREQIKKSVKKKKKNCFPRPFYTLYEHNFSNLRPHPFLGLPPKVSKDLTCLDIGLWEVGLKDY